MKYADLPRQRLNHLVKPEGKTLEEWQVMLRMQQAQREHFDVECVSERYHPGEYRVSSPRSGSVYKVVYRGPRSPWNYCDCMDFKTSQLGTCKHIEGARQWIADHHKRIHRDLPPYTSVYLSYRGNQRRVNIRIGSTREADFRALAAKYFDELGTLMPHACTHFGTFLAAARALDDGFRCYPDARDFVIEQREAMARRQAVAERYSDEAMDQLLRTRLYPYQKQGVRFAAAAGRAILADEMGLGKTVQALATAELLRRERFVGSVLILCPATLMYQWKHEVERFTAARALVVEGTPERRRELMAAEAPYKIASYRSVAAEQPEAPDMMILDEVQRLKNWNTQTARAVRRIPSRYRIILSGTPLENRLEELYSVVELVDQYLLAPYYVFRDRHIVTDAEGRTIGYRNLADIRPRTAPVMLRRTKAEVAMQLPPRIDKNLFVPMTPRQAEAHAELRRQAARLVAKWHRQHFLSEMDRKQLLLTLTQMRMTCDSLYVLDEHSRHDTKVEEVMNILDECGVTVDGEAPAAAARQTRAGEDGPATTPHKVVIFSQWERMTRLVAQELERSGVEYVYLHGSVPPRERQQRAEAFQTDPTLRVFLSTDAGSTGLNLQAASVVVNIDLPWNPAVLEQRIARLHRLGQQRGVEVINLIAAGTIEEDMLSRLRFKTSLFEGVLDGGEDAVFLASDQMDGLLDSLRRYMEEPAPPAPLPQAAAQAPLQAMLDFAAPQEAAPAADAPGAEGSQAAQPATAPGAAGAATPAPAAPADLASIAALMSRLLTADEATRRQAADLLQRLVPPAPPDRPRPTGGATTPPA